MTGFYKTIFTSIHQNPKPLLFSTQGSHPSQTSTTYPCPSCSSKTYCHNTPVLIDLHWLPVCQRIEFKIATTAFNVLHCQQPSYSAEMLPRYTPSRSLRPSASMHNHLCPFEENSDGIFKIIFSSCIQHLDQFARSFVICPTLPAFRKPLKYHLLLHAYIGSITPATSATLTTCRPHSAFQRSAYDQQFCTHTGACANAALLIYLLDGESFG